VTVSDKLFCGAPTAARGTYISTVIPIKGFHLPRANKKKKFFFFTAETVVENNFVWI
jgi:hypothetical protein